MVDVGTDVRLWADVPENERVTEEMLLEREMAHKKDGWLERQLERQAKPACRAAVRYAPWLGKRTENIFQPCGSVPAPGESLCMWHGGAKRPRPAERERRKALAERRVVSAERRVERLKVLTSEATDELKWALDELAAVTGGAR